MACEILACCQLFEEKRELPKTTEYIKNKFCLNKFESCPRFLLYKKYQEGYEPLEYYPYVGEEVKKVIKCLQEKNKSKN